MAPEKWCTSGHVADCGSFGPDGRHQDGLQSKCRPCQAKARGPRVFTEAQKRRMSQRYQNHAETIRARSLKRLYGLSKEAWDELFQTQDGKCAICGRQPTDTGKRGGGLHVDHDHRTGLVRALLCGNCNHLLGQAKDDPTVLRRALQYLERHG